MNKYSLKIKKYWTLQPANADFLDCVFSWSAVCPKVQPPAGKEATFGWNY